MEKEKGNVGAGKVGDGEKKGRARRRWRRGKITQDTSRKEGGKRGRVREKENEKGKGKGKGERANGRRTGEVSGQHIEDE